MTQAACEPNAVADPLACCRLCAHGCGIDRRKGQTGFCRAGPLPCVARWLSHGGEEPPLSGTRGSGTIFFSGCSLRCVFCQNAAISQTGEGQEMTPEGLAGIMLELQTMGCHNVNLVSPTHHAVSIAAAIGLARRRGLSVPVVYNSHGYDGPDALACMAGLVDIYLVDMKYASDRMARVFSGADGYREANRAALREMMAQVGPLQVDTADGLATRGVLVRILLLPEGLEGVEASLSYLKSRFSRDLPVSIMSQYAPVYRASGYPPVDRPLLKEEYEAAVAFAVRLGFRNLWLQDLGSSAVGVPDFTAPQPCEF